MNTREAITETKRFAQFIKAFQHLTAVADELAQAEQLVIEANARKQKIDTQTQASTDELGAIERQISQAKNDYAEMLGQAEVRAEEIIAAATAEAGHIAAASVQDNESASAEIARLRATADEARTALEAITAEHASIAEKLATARKDIRAFITEEG